MTIPTTLPQPSPDHEKCYKCFGSGFFCLGIHNGQPYSNTGFACYPCAGRGWVARKATATAPAPDATATPAPAPAPALSLPFKSKADAKRQLQALLDASDRAVNRCILAIYALQTEDEKMKGATVEDNGIGFSGCDAELLTSFAHQLQDRGFLTQKQMTYARKKARKYWNQLRQIIEAKQVPA